MYLTPAHKKRFIPKHETNLISAVPLNLHRKSETCNVIYYVYTYYISAHKLRSDLLILFPLSAFTKCRTLLLVS